MGWCLNTSFTAAFITRPFQSCLLAVEFAQPCQSCNEEHPELIDMEFVQPHVSWNEEHPELMTDF